MKYKDYVKGECPVCGKVSKFYVWEPKKRKTRGGKK